MKATRRRFLSATGAAGVTALAGCMGGGGDTLKVGYALPFTGVYSDLGESIVNGFDLRLNQIDWGINGTEVETVQRDTEADTDSGVSVVTELLIEENVDVLVGPVSSAVAVAMMSTVAQEGSAIWLNACAGDYRVIEDGCSPYHFRTGFNDWQTSAPLAEWVYDNVADNVYLAYADYAFGENSKEFFAEAFEEAGGEIVDETSAPLGTNDFSPYLGSIEDSDADAVFSFFAGSDAVNYIRAFNDFGLDEEITQVGSGFLLAGDTLPGQGDAALGKYSLLHYTNTNELNRNQEFVENYQDEYDERPNVYSCQGYDSAQAFEQAVTQTGSANPDDLIEELRGMEIDSPRGYFQFNPETHDPIQDMHVREVVEGDDGEPENEVIETIEQVEGPSWGCSQ
ncbi:ABC transporter substrate-binding protein [Natrialbaceae archaeon A-gly3]